MDLREPGVHGRDGCDGAVAVREPDEAPDGVHHGVHRGAEVLMRDGRGGLAAAVSGLIRVLTTLIGVLTHQVSTARHPTFGVTTMHRPSTLTYISVTSAHLSAVECCHDRGLVRTSV